LHIAILIIPLRTIHSASLSEVYRKF